MFIKLADLPQEGRHLEATWPARTIGLGHGGELQSKSASAQVLVIGEGNGYRIKGSAEAEGVLTCARCLEAVTWQGSLPVDALALPQSEISQKSGDHRMTMDTVDHAYFEGEGVELWDLVESAWRLALPQRILCSEDCSGLCASCGTNLNENSCGCEAEGPQDETKKALAGLLEQMKENHHG